MVWNALVSHQDANQDDFRKLRPEFNIAEDFPLEPNKNVIEMSLRREATANQIAHRQRFKHVYTDFVAQGVQEEIATKGGIRN
eukprot:scaffold22559_cov111-Cylindrotheca_fusiformis.AAC.13